jgi:hypothetical protein
MVEAVVWFFHGTDQEELTAATHCDGGRPWGGSEVTNLARGCMKGKARAGEGIENVSDSRG